jgi:hypothetical protein
MVTRKTEHIRRITTASVLLPSTRLFIPPRPE